MNDDTDFTDRERYILSYFRNAGPSIRRQRLAVDGSLIGLSVAFLIVGFSRSDAGCGVFAYVILLWRGCVSLWQTRTYTDDYKNIFAKYEAKIEALTAAQPHSNHPES